jgi:hypothetical protein
MTEVTLVESTVTPVGETRVGCGNVWEREYVLPDGRSARGLTARLAPADADEPVVVGLGSVVDLGGELWRVAAIEKQTGKPGRLRLVGADQGTRIEGIDLGAGADVAGFVAAELARPTPRGGDDRHPVDFIDRLYARALAVDQGAADRVSRAVAAAFGAHDARVDQQALMFFQWRPMAAGGDRLGAVIASAPERFPRTAPPLEPDHLSARERAIRVALRWGDEQHPRDPALRRLARDEALAGHGAGFVGWLIADDPVWGRRHEPALIAANPDALGDLYDGLRALGTTPEAAIDRLIATAPTSAGRKGLLLALRFEAALDAPAKERLSARVRG